MRFRSLSRARLSGVFPESSALGESVTLELSEGFGAVEYCFACTEEGMKGFTMDLGLPVLFVPGEPLLLWALGYESGRVL
jgi:hypothetical protein